MGRELLKNSSGQMDSFEDDTYWTRPVALAFVGDAVAAERRPQAVVFASCRRLWGPTRRKRPMQKTRRVEVPPLRCRRRSRRRGWMVFVGGVGGRMPWLF
jgi:hypothetical protein